MMRRRAKKLQDLDYRHLHPTKPCRHHDGKFDPYRQMEKIKDEYKEAYEASVYWRDQPTGKNREKQLEELIDMATAITTYIAGAGYTKEEVEREICRVNLKNWLRGYWEEAGGHDGL
nr:hypothetical protein [Mitsuokella multacida]